MKLSHWFFTLIAFFLIAVLIYSPSLSGPFQYDDYAQILDNKVLTGRPLPKLLSSIFRFTAHPDGWTGTRDLVRATFLLNWQWWGERPLGYRWVNLIIHIINSTLVSGFVYLILAKSKSEDRHGHGSEKSRFQTQFPNPASKPKPDLPSILAGLLFLVHPLNSQAVAYVAQRFTSVATMFYLGTVICWLLFLRRRHYFLLFTSYFLALLAYNSKEIAVTLPLALALVTGYQFSVVSYQSRVNRFSVSQFETEKLKTGKHGTENRKPKTDNRIKTLLFLLPFFLLALKIPLQIATAASAGGEAAVTKIDLDAFALKQKEDLLSRRDYFLTQISVVGTYLRLAVLPVNQTLDYDYPVTRAPDPKTLALAALHLGLIGIGGWFLLSNRQSVAVAKPVSASGSVSQPQPPHHSSLATPTPSLFTRRLIGLGLLWFYLTLLPESSIIPIPDVIYEHRAYLPMVGLIISAAALAAARHETHGSHKSHVSHVVVAAAIMLILAAATFRRASVWGNEVRLWADVYAKAPQKPRAVKNYGVVLAAAGKYDDGIKLLEKAVVLDPDNADYWSNLGTANLRAGRYDSAKDKFLRAYELLAAELGLPPYGRLRTFQDETQGSQPSDLSEKSRRQAAQYLNDYGVCLVQLGRGEEAQQAFEKSLAIDPGLYAARLGLGAAYNLMGETQQAIDVFEAAVEEFPDLPDAYNNLAVMYKKAGRLEDHNRILRAAPKSPKSPKSPKIP